MTVKPEVLRGLRSFLHGLLEHKCGNLEEKVHDSCMAYIKKRSVLSLFCKKNFAPYFFYHKIPNVSLRRIDGQQIKHQI